MISDDSWAAVHTQISDDRSNSPKHGKYVMHASYSTSLPMQYVESMVSLVSTLVQFLVYVIRPYDPQVEGDVHCPACQSLHLIPKV